MAVVQLRIRDLASRGQEVRDLLRPLVGKSGGPAWQPRASSNEYIIGTHQGSPPSSDYRDWRFSMGVRDFQAMYFERWLRSPENKPEIWYLHRAYLNIYQLVNRKEIEFICLHCDPNEPDGAPHARFKKGPHLHVKVASPPVCDAHIALHLGCLESVLTSASSLSDALKSSIDMLVSEIWPRLALEGEPSELQEKKTTH